jgi:alpha-L-fucosidase 2
LRLNHLNDYQELFARVCLRLDAGIDMSSTPTDKRLGRLRDGHEDPELACLYFQYARYLLIACSRPGSLPATLQGIWNKDMIPFLESKYTINVNTQMNYWLAEPCHLPECHEPLFDLLERMCERGQETARVMYGCRGFVAHHNTDIWADTAPQDICISSTYWPMGAAWLCLHLWEHYLFTLDKAFLRRSYEIMKQAALFLLDFLIEDSEGRLVTCPSISPENAYLDANGNPVCLCAGPAMEDRSFMSCLAPALKLHLS